MDFLSGYDDDDGSVYDGEKVEEVTLSTLQVTNSEPIKGEQEDIAEYEDFNVDYHHEGSNADEVSSDNGSGSETDSEDEFGPRPALSSRPSEENHDDTDFVAENNQKSAEECFDDYVQQHKIPVACEVSIGGHSRAVTAVSVEPAGNRFVTGSMDYSVKLFDFGGMDSRHRAFASMEPQDGHPVWAISHSPNGDRFVVATSSAQPKVYDRDGHDIITFVKGDMYLRDLSNTKGHTMSVTCVQWHPVEKNLIVTSSLDGTVRLWDLLGEAAFGNLINIFVLKPTQDKSIVSAISTAHGHGSGGGVSGAITRTAVTSCVFSPVSGNRIYAGLSNGNIVGWQNQTASASSSSRRYYYSPLPTVFIDPFDTTILGGSNDNSSRSVISLAISPNEELLAARYANGVVLVWDLKNKRVVQRCLHLMDGLYVTANVAFSPDSKRFCCCALLPAEEGNAESSTEQQLNSNSSENDKKKKPSPWGKPRLMVFDSFATADAHNASITTAVVSEKVLRRGAVPALALAIGDVGQVGIYCRWHRSTNQIFVTMSHGVTKVFFDAKMIPGDNPRKGAVLSSQRAPARSKDPSDFAIVGEIINPLALPLYRKDNHPAQERKRKAQELKDPTLAKIPEKPLKQGPGSRPNTSFFFTNYVMDNQAGKLKPDIRSEDPREALLKYADVAKDDPRFLGRAYAASQPKSVLAQTTFEEEQEQFKKRQKTL